MACRWTTVTAALTCLANLWSQGDAQTCRAPRLASGTKHNGTAIEEYPPNTVLSYSCDTGYKLNYKSPTSLCAQSSGQSTDLSWNPPDIKCDLDVVSLAVAIIVAFVGIIVFIMAMVWLAKRRKVTDSRNIKRKARDNTYDYYQPRGSSKQNGHVNQGMESIEMETRGTVIGGNGNVISSEGRNGQANGLLWSPPPSKGSVMQDSETAVLQRSRKSSATSRSSRTDNLAADNSSSGVQLNPDYGDVEFGAGGAHFQNFKDIGSSMASFANPSMPRLNNMDTSIAMPDASNPSMIAEGDMSPDSGGDFSDLYASVDMSKRKNKRGSKVNNNNSNFNNVVTVATIESDGAYSTVGSHSPQSGSFSAHEEALADNSSGYSAIKVNENDYSEVKIEEISPGENLELDSIYAKVDKVRSGNKGDNM